MANSINVAAFTALNPLLFKDVPKLSLPADFNIQSVDETMVVPDASDKPHFAVERLTTDQGSARSRIGFAVGDSGPVKHAQIPLVQTPAPQPLPSTDPKIPSVLGLLKGTFVGSGFNTIFRPSNAANRLAAQADVDLKPEVPIDVAPGVNDDNILELNLTIEALVFTPKEIGKVPNRGMDEQPDIILHGVPYVQTIWDVTNPATGKADDIPRGIHFEPGMFLIVPSTKRPNAATSITRMASIPHGTTINLSGPDAIVTNGPPPLEKVVANPDPNTNFNTSPPKFSKNFFPNTIVGNKGTPRLPPNLDEFQRNGTITQDLLDEPVNLLVAINKVLGDRITKTHTFTVGSGKMGEKFSGDVASIAFLTGNDPGNKPNANVPSVISTFWVEIVNYDVQVPPMKPGETKNLKPTNLLPGASLPQFCITAPTGGFSKGGKVTVPSIQVQYAQKVMLSFAPGGGPFSWPHVSVASLVPLVPVPVDTSKFSGL
jgi:hypothetical protein